jgi:hypothetical protein
MVKKKKIKKLKKENVNSLLNINGKLIIIV